MKKSRRDGRWIIGNHKDSGLKGLSIPKSVERLSYGLNFMRICTIYSQCPSRDFFFFLPYSTEQILDFKKAQFGLEVGKDEQVEQRIFRVMKIL